jgi:hypothetical protein
MHLKQRNHDVKDPDTVGNPYRGQSISHPNRFSYRTHGRAQDLALSRLLQHCHCLVQKPIYIAQKHIGDEMELFPVESSMALLNIARTCAEPWIEIAVAE